MIRGILTDKRTNGILLTLALMGSIALAGDAFAPTALQNTITHYFITLVLVVGLNVTIGNSGVLSFGHVGFMALGAYATALLTLPAALKKILLPNLPEFLGALQLDVWAALPIALLVVTIAGGLVGLLICRLNGAAAAIATLGLLVIVNSVLIGASDFTRGSQALYGVPKTVGIFTALAFAAAAVILARLFKDSPHGLMVRAAREEETAAHSIGIEVNRVRLVAWTASIALVATGGILFAHYIGVFSPKEFFFHQTFALLVMLIVGGMTSVSGAVTGTTAVFLLVEVLRRLEEGGTVAGFEVPHLFGLTDIGLSVAVLIALYRRGTGLLGYREIDDILPLGRRLREGVVQLPARLSNIADAKPRTASDAPSLTAQNLRKTYGGVTALDSADIKLHPQEIVGLIGPNGSGKTTLLSCLSGTQPLTGGTVVVDGQDVTGRPPARIARSGIGRTFQNIRLFNKLSVLENVETALLASGQAQTRKESYAKSVALLSRLGIEGEMERAADELSYGQQRRLEIARALATAPRYLLLDEPAAGMNDAETKELMQFLSALRDESGIGIFLVDHDLHLILNLCDRIIVLDKGQIIAEGPPDEVRRHPAVIEAYLGGTAAHPGAPDTKENNFQKA